MLYSLNHVLVLKKVHRVVEFNRNAWLKEYIDIYCELPLKYNFFKAGG